jgi:hypothetical protein
LQNKELIAFSNEMRGSMNLDTDRIEIVMHRGKRAGTRDAD